MRGEPRDLPAATEEHGPAASSGHRRRWIAAGAVTVTVAAAAAIATSSLGGAGETDASEAASQSTATTKIVEQDLVERETVDGTLGYSDARAVINRLGGTVTWTPRVGSVVETNHRLYEIDGKAVYLLDGAYPAYRTLESGTDGDDVLALERNLRALGLDTSHDMSVDGTWDSGTTAAVKRWQDRKGMTQTGSIEKGRIVFQPGSRRIGDIAIGAGQSASSGGGGGGGNEPAAAKNTGAVMQNASVVADGGGAVLRTAALTEPAPLSTDEETAVGSADGYTAVRVQDATTPVPTTPSSTPAPAPSPSAQRTPPVATPKPASPRAPSGASSGAPQAQSGSGAAPSAGRGAAAGGSAPSGSGASAGAAGGSSSAAADVSSTLMTTTSVKRIVAVDLEATKQALAKRGGEVSVELPDGKDVDGTIATVSKVAQKKASSSQEDPPATIKVIVKLKTSAGTGLDQAPVDVSLEKTRAKDVLTVPVTALIARQGGTFAVEVRDRGARRIVEVETGLYTDSFVEIEGAGLSAGMTVTNARI